LKRSPPLLQWGSLSPFFPSPSATRFFFCQGSCILSSPFCWSRSLIHLCAHSCLSRCFVQLCSFYNVLVSFVRLGATPVSLQDLVVRSTGAQARLTDPSHCSVFFLMDQGTAAHPIYPFLHVSFAVATGILFLLLLFFVLPSPFPRYWDSAADRNVSALFLGSMFFLLPTHDCGSFPSPRVPWLAHCQDFHAGSSSVDVFPIGLFR